MSRDWNSLSRREQLMLLGATGVSGLAGCLGEEDEADGDDYMDDDAGEADDGTDDDGDDTDDDADDGDDEVEDEDEETGPWGEDEADATFWAWGGLNDMRFEKSEAFFEETDNRTRWEHFPFADYDTNLRSVLGDGGGPDLTSLSVSWLPEFASFDQLEELDYEDDLGITLIDGARENSSYEDQLYAYPWYVDCRMVAINLDAWEDAGLEAPSYTDHVTWEEFDEWMAAFEDDDTNGLVLSEEGFETFWLSNGGRMTEEDDITNVTMNSDEIVNTAEWMLEHVENDNVSLSEEHVEDWLAGAGAMLSIAGSWEFERINEEATFDWQYIPVPVGPDGDGTSYSWSAGVYYAVPVHAENPDIAHEFGEWLVSDEFQSNLSLLGGEPVTESAYETDEYQQFIEDNPRYETILQEIQNTVTRPAHPERAQVTEMSQEAGARALHGEMSPEESYDQAQQEIEGLLQQ